jgi:3-oxoacyl-[acyl-carrier-protein] synthase-1
VKARAFIASVGARTAIGQTAVETGFLLRTGLPALAAAPLVDAEGEPITMGFDPTLDPYLVGEDRAAALAAPALAEALAPLGDLSALTIKLILCVDQPLVPRARGEATPGARLAALVHARARELAPGIPIEVVARGAAGAAFALPAAIEALNARRLDAVVIGGAHTDYDPDTIHTLDAARRIFTPENLDSLVPGEAAAFVVLLREDVARRLDLRPPARITGIGTGVAANTAPAQGGAIRAPGAFEATALTAAVRAAGEELVESQLRLGWTLTDLTFEVRRVHEWQAAVTRAGSLFGEPHQVDSPAQRIGHLGAAALPLHLTLAAEGWRRGFAPSGIALALAGSEGGERGAIVLSSNV